MLTLTVRLLKPAKDQVITFPAVLMRFSANERVVRADWQRPTLDLGYVTFVTNDTLIEYYYTDRWYTIYALYGRGPYHDLDTWPLYPGSERDHINRVAVPPWVVRENLKGWYCNVARPARFDATSIASEDLEIDLFVSPDRQTLLTLDMDEFEARGFAEHDPVTYQAALDALAELQQLARAGKGAFAPIQWED